MEENCISDLFLFKSTLLSNDSDCLPKVCYLKLKKLRYLSKLRLSESVGASAAKLVSQEEEEYEPDFSPPSDYCNVVMSNMFENATGRGEHVNDQ